ncbi:MAG: hypothetical protein ACLFV5_11310 [Anaerolineales bacterium]
MRILRKIGKGILILAGIALVVAVGYGIFLLLSALLRRTAALDETVVAALVASLTGVFGYWYTQRESKSREIAEAHRPKKIELYRTFMDILQRFIQPSLDDEDTEIDPENLSKDVQDLFFEFNRGLIVWGSPSMIETWLRFRSEANLPDAENRALLLMDEVLRSIRKDLGNSNFGLNDGDLVKIFLKDPEELDRLIELHPDE